MTITVHVLCHSPLNIDLSSIERNCGKLPMLNFPVFTQDAI